MITSIYNSLESRLEAQQNPMRAQGMKAYMKDHFEFYGVGAQERKAIVSQVKKEFKINTREIAMPLMEKLWAHPMREMQYCAIDIMSNNAKKLITEDIPALEKAMITKSWWDTVDHIAPNFIGILWQNHPESREAYIEKWMNSENMWLNRAAIIHQLRYKKSVNIDYLAATILKHEHSKEFFIRKAQGWALREYSKVNPVWVSDFLEANPQLSGLTHREASKYL
jgi:3-methyladenine DNA glycosylase AlkD